MIFICYSRENSSCVRQLTKEIIGQGYKVIIDPALVEGDAFWRNAVSQNLKKTTLMLVLWSAQAAKSPWVEQEIKAFKGQKTFIALDSTCIPAGYECIKIYPGDTQALLAKLGLSKGKFTQNNNATIEQIAALRLLKFREWSQKLDVIYNKMKTTPLLQHVAENKWLAPDGSIVKPILHKLQEIKTSNSIVLISTTPVTNKQYKQFIEFMNWPEPTAWQKENFRHSECPVVGINWFEAAAYAYWQGGCLPSVAEWEACARGQYEDTVYATNNNTLSYTNALFMKNFDEDNPVDATHYPANPNGFYGLCGNTWDWCRDQQEQYCTIKGGGYMDSASFCKITAGYRNSLIDRDCCVGFRLRFELKIA